MTHLIINSYPATNSQRRAENAEALRRNRACKFIDRIHEITNPEHRRFGSSWRKRGRVGWADIVIVANSDIYFDDTATLLDYIGHSECFALARYEEGGEFSVNPAASQDAWVFRGWPPDVAADFPLGVAGVDQLFGQLLRNAGYSVYNRCRSIKCHHLHVGGARVRKSEDAIPREYAYLPPCGIEHIRHRSSDAIETPGKIAIVLLGGFGDIVNALPIAMDLHRKGHEVSWYVHRDFAALLEGASYVKPAIWEGEIEPPDAAVAHARSRGFDRVLCLQVNADNPASPHSSRNLLTESWAAAGYLDKYHILPCVFDRAQAPPEDWKPAGGKAILAYCLEGQTSPYAADLKADLVRWLGEKYGRNLNWWRLAGGTADRIRCWRFCGNRRFWSAWTHFRCTWDTRRGRRRLQSRREGGLDRSRGGIGSSI